MQIESLSTENQVNFRSPRNISGVSDKNNVVAFSETTEVDGDLT